MLEHTKVRSIAPAFLCPAKCIICDTSVASYMRPQGASLFSYVPHPFFECGRVLIARMFFPRRCVDEIPLGIDIGEERISLGPRAYAGDKHLACILHGLLIGARAAR